MEIIVGKSAGFCGGVFNSVSKTEKALEDNDYMYCLGEIVHNKQVVDKLTNKGLKVIDNLDNIKNEKVIVRAHGISKNIYEQANKNKVELIDLTCPKVLKIHQIAEDYVKDGYFIVLIAKKDHPEAIGTIGYCGEDSYVLEDDSGMDELLSKINNCKKNKVAVIAQTTYSVSKFEQLSSLIKDRVKGKEVIINSTICNATSIRQKECDEISRNVDTMIIVGGKNSSNTKKLYEIACKNCPNSIIIETCVDLDVSLLKDSKKVGVMAGASTPKESIEEV